MVTHTNDYLLISQECEPAGFRRKIPRFPFVLPFKVVFLFTRLISVLVLPTRDASGGGKEVTQREESVKATAI